MIDINQMMNNAMEQAQKMSKNIQSKTLGFKIAPTPQELTEKINNEKNIMPISVFMADKEFICFYIK